MAQLQEYAKFEQLIQKTDPESKLLRTWELKGGVSAQVTALEIEQSGGHTKKMIVRRHGAVDLQHNPQIAADEYRLLEILRVAGIPAPAPYYFDQSSEIFATPYIVIEYIEGNTEFSPSDLVDFTRQLATQLSRIHNVDCLVHDLSFLPKQEEIAAKRLKARPAKADESLGEGHIRDTLQSAWPLPRRNRPVLLHGDFWPGNILWNEGKLIAVIDWEDAHTGDSLADLANSRLEILWAFGIDAMDNFTRQYQSRTTVDFANLPYWDLYAALRHAEKSTEWATYDMDENIMRTRHRLFTAQAFEKLSV